MNSNFKEIIYEKLTANNIFFEYDIKTNTITIIYKDEFLFEHEKIDYDKLDIKIDKKNRKIIDDFMVLAIETCSKEQTSFKAKSNNIDKWYLIETFPRNELSDKIYGSIKNLTKLLIDQDRLIELGKKDALTGLYNRASLEKYIEDNIDKKSFFILAEIDIDYFKEINDTYGHIVGDNVLVEVANALREYAGKDGIVGRIGGDEFMIVKYYDHAPLFQEVRQFCIGLKSEMLNLRNTKINSKTVTVTTGAACYPFDGLDFKTLYSKVDKALYRGKAKGRNCYVIFNSVLHSSIDTSKPLIASYEWESLDFSIFAGNILNSLLSIPTREKAVSKFADIAYYFRASRLTLYKRVEGRLEIIDSWSDPEYQTLPLTTIDDFNQVFNYLDNGCLIIQDMVEFRRLNGIKCINVSYEHGSLLMVPVGLRRASDMYCSIETIGERRAWNNYQLTAFKTLARIVVSFIEINN